MAGVDSACRLHVRCARGTRRTAEFNAGSKSSSFPPMDKPAPATRSPPSPPRHADDGAVSSRSRRPTRIACCSTGWAISTSCSSTMPRSPSRALGIALTKRGKHLGARHPDVRRAGPCRRRLSAEADRGSAIASRSASRSRTRPRRRKRGAQVGGQARRRPPGDARHAHRGHAARRRREPTILAALARVAGGGDDRPSRSPGSTSRPATSASPRRDADAACRRHLPRIDPRETDRRRAAVRTIAALQPLFDVLGARRRRRCRRALLRSAPAPSAGSRAISASRRSTASARSRAPSWRPPRRVARLCREDADRRAAAAVAARRARPRGDVMLIDAATRANLELTAHAVGRARAAACSPRSTAPSPAPARGCSPSGSPAPLTDAGVDRRAARCGRLHARRRRDAARRICASARSARPTSPRALSRLALDRGGPRDLAAHRATASTRPRAIAGAARRSASCRRRDRRRALAALARGCRPILPSDLDARRSPTTCRC